MSHYWGEVRRRFLQERATGHAERLFLLVGLVFFKVRASEMAGSGSVHLGGEIILAQPKSLRMFNSFLHFYLCIFTKMKSRDS